jgi:hypothetical protein
LWLKIILLPGVIISESIVDFFNLFRSWKVYRIINILDTLLH